MTNKIASYSSKRISNSYICSKYFICLPNSCWGLHWSNRM